MNALAVAGHTALAMRSGGYACSRRGAAFPIWRPTRDAALALLDEWATADHPRPRGEAAARLATANPVGEALTEPVGAGANFRGEVVAQFEGDCAPAGHPG